MIEIKIPQEINKYESKLVGPLTTRQTACVVCMTALCAGTYYILKDIINSDILYFTCFLMAVPFGVIGWYKPYGMRAEKFILAVLFNTIISSSRRIFKSQNIISIIENKFSIPDVKEMNDKKGKRKPKAKKATDPKKIRNSYKKDIFR